MASSWHGISPHSNRSPPRSGLTPTGRLREQEGTVPSCLICRPRDAVPSCPAISSNREFPGNLRDWGRKEGKPVPKGNRPLIRGGACPLLLTQLGYWDDGDGCVFLGWERQGEADAETATGCDC